MKDEITSPPKIKYHHAQIVRVTSGDKRTMVHCKLPVQTKDYLTALQVKFEDSNLVLGHSCDTHRKGLIGFNKCLGFFSLCEAEKGKI